MQIKTQILKSKTGNIGLIKDLLKNQGEIVLVLIKLNLCINQNYNILRQLIKPYKLLIKDRKHMKTLTIKKTIINKAILL